jgi:uncharacterized membrane protein
MFLTGMGRRFVTSCNNFAAGQPWRYTCCMKYVRAVVVIAVVFTVIDLAWISFYLGDVYDAQLSSIMRTTPLAVPAALFYVGYIAAMLFFAVRPALAEKRVTVAIVNGAVLGAVAYGTYTLTNHAILSDWAWHLVASDIAWGAILTGACSACGYLAARTS